MSGSVGTAFVDLQPRLGAAFGAGLAGKLKGLVGPAAVVGIGAGLFSVGKKFEGLFNQIKVGTGASGGALEGLEKDAKAVLAGTAGSFDQVGAAVTGLAQRTGLTGKALQDLAKKEVSLARITKSDVATNIASTTRVFGDWGIATDKQGEALDKLFRASQLTGSSVDQLASGVVRFGAPLRQLGFSFEEGIGLLGKFEKEGVNTNLVMGSMRIALGKLAKSGKEPVAAFREQVDAIKAAGDAGKANALALELFGARAGPDMAAAIREGRFDLKELFDQISSGKGSIEKTASSVSTISGKFARLKNIALVALEPIGSKLVDIATVGMGKLVDGVVAAGPIVGKAFTFIRERAQELGSAVAEKLAPTFDRIRTVASRVFKGAQDVIANFGDFVRGNAAGIGVAIGKMFGFQEDSGATGGIIRFAQQARDALGDFLTKAREVGAGIAAALGRIDFSAILGRVREALGTVVEAVRNVDFGAILGRLKDIVAPIIPPVLELGRAVIHLAIAAFPVLVRTGKDLVAFAIKLKPLWAALAVGAYVLARAAGVVLAVAIKVIAKATQLLADHATILRPLLFGLAAGFVALKVVRGVQAGILGVARAAGTAYGTMARLASSARGAASALANNAKNALAAGRTVLTLVVNVAKQTAAFVAQKVAMIAAAVAQKAMAAAQWLLNAAMSANPVTLIVAGIAALAAGIVLAYQHFGPFRAVVDAVGRALATVAGVITGGLGKAFDWIKSHWPLLLAILTGPFGLAVLAITRNWSKITGGARAALGAITGFFKKLPEVILGAVTGAGRWLLEVGKRVLGGLGAGARAALGVYLRFYVELPLKILEKLTTAGTWLFGIGKKIVGGMLRGAREIITHVYDVFTGAKDAILGKLGDVLGWLKQAGKDVVSGFLNGIKERWDDLTGWIGKAASHLPGFIKGPLGIGSPSKVFAGLGVNVMEGLELGLERGLPKVERRLTDVAKRFLGVKLAIPTPKAAGDLAGARAFIGAPKAPDPAKAKRDHDAALRAINALWTLFEKRPDLTAPKVVKAPTVDPRRYLGVFKPDPVHVDQTAASALAGARAFIGAASPASPAGGLPPIKQENHFHGADKPTTAELGYAGRVLAFTVANTGRKL